VARRRAVERAVERGITFFDTAPSYGDGASEALLGRTLGPHREQVAIATKVGPYDDPRRSLEASLRRLVCDYVDLLQLHEGRERGLCFLAYRPLASELLTGKYAAPPEFAEVDHRRGIYWFKGAEFERRGRVIDRLRPIARGLDMPLAGLALAWVLAQPGVSIV